MKIRVIESRPLNSGNRVVTGAMDAQDLVGHAVVDIRDWKQQTGYQRRHDNKRVSDIAHGIKNLQVDMPMSFLVGIRAPDTDVLAGSGKSLTLDLNSNKIHIIDAQHRIGALAKLADEGDDSYGLVSVNFVLDSDEIIEMELFHTANAKQKQITVNLRYDLTKTRYDSDSNYRKIVERDGEKWIVDGQRLAEGLAEAKNSGLWRGLIKFPHEARAGTMIANGGMVNSLRNLATSDLFGKECTDRQQLNILNAFWRAVSRALPACFVPTEIASYNLQKSIGTEVMHGVLYDALEAIAADSGRDAISRAMKSGAYAFIKPALRSLTAENGKAETVKGPEFWREGPSGASGQHSNNVARRLLIRTITQYWHPGSDLEPEVPPSA